MSTSHEKITIKIMNEKVNNDNDKVPENVFEDSKDQKLNV